MKQIWGWGWALWVGAMIAPVEAATTLPVLQGPGVNPADFRVTAFATGLDFPVGMAELADGSLLVAVNDGASFGSSVGKLVRFVDANQDGVADDSGTVHYSGLPGGLSSLRVSAPWVFVTGQGRGKPIHVLRQGTEPSSPLTSVGTLDLTYPSGSWLHPHSALAVRTTAGVPQQVELYFQLGSEFNLQPTARTVSLSSAAFPGAAGVLSGDSVYRVTFTVQSGSLLASAPVHVAKGLRNAAGMAFEPGTGDLVFQDNGIDGLVNVNEPESADELNRVPASALGQEPVPDFGFPNSYIKYRTGQVVGGLGIAPEVAFQPWTGSESEGAADIAFAPPEFPEGLNQGVFVGFHGRYSSGGVANEENPLVFVDLRTREYFHLIGNQEPQIGHLDGVISTRDSLFLADLSSTGSLSARGQGVIYQIKALTPPRLDLLPTASGFELRWSGGTLESTSQLANDWLPLPAATSPYPISTDLDAQYFRVRP